MRHWASILAGAFTAALGGAVLAGWYTHNLTLIQVFPGLLPMQINAAVAFLLCGIGMLLIAFGYKRSGQVCGALVAAFSLMTVVEYLFDVNLGIDELIMYDYVLARVANPGRMAPNAAIALSLSGIALIVMGGFEQFRQRGITVVLLGAVIFSLGTAAAVGYLSHVETAYGWGRPTRMALHTTAGLMVLGIGVMAYGWRSRETKVLDIRELRNSIVLYTTGGVLLMVLISSTMAVLPVYEGLRQHQEREIMQIVRTKSVAIEQVMLRMQAVARQISSRSRARELLRDFEQGRITGEAYAAESRAILTDALANSAEVVGITRLDDRGETAVTVGASIDEALWPERLGDSNVSVVGPVRAAEALHVVVRSPIRDTTGQELGSDIVLVRFSGIRQVLCDRSGLGETGRIYLGTSEPSGLKLFAVRNCTTDPEPVEVEERHATAMQRALTDGPGAMTPGTQQPPRLMAFGPVSGSDWVVMVSISANDLYAPLTRQLLLVVAGVVALGLIGALTMYVLVRPLTGGILFQADALEKRIREATVALEHELAERKRAESRLHQATVELQRSNRELAQFASVASHDLQEPLRMISSYLQLIERRYYDKMDQDGHDFIGFAVDGAARMQQMINDILAYARVGTRGEPFTQVNCTTVMQEVQSNLQAAIAQSNATITYDELPVVTADRTQMVQLFQNLVANAIKFRREEPPRIHVSAEQDGKMVTFRVQDNGIGIEPQYAERIFDLFQKLHPRGEYSGTGIGLPICKRIVERHQGRIWYESRVGAGTSFYFTLSNFSNPVERQAYVRNTHQGIIG